MFHSHLICTCKIISIVTTLIMRSTHYCSKIWASFWPLLLLLSISCLYLNRIDALVTGNLVGQVKIGKAEVDDQFRQHFNQQQQKSQNESLSTGGPPKPSPSSLDDVDPLLIAANRRSKFSNATRYLPKRQSIWTMPKGHWLGPGGDYSLPGMGQLKRHQPGNEGGGAAPAMQCRDPWNQWTFIRPSEFKSVESMLKQSAILQHLSYFPPVTNHYNGHGLVMDVHGADFGDSAFVFDRLANYNENTNLDTIIGIFFARATSKTIREGAIKANYLTKFFYDVKEGYTLTNVRPKFLITNYFHYKPEIKDEVGYIRPNINKREDIRISFFGDITEGAFDEGAFDGVLYFKDGVPRPVYLEFDLAKPKSLRILPEKVFGGILKNITVATYKNNEYLTEEMAFIPQRPSPLGAAPCIASPMYNSMLLECSAKENWWLARHIIGKYPSSLPERLYFNCVETNDSINNYQPFIDMRDDENEPMIASSYYSSGKFLIGSVVILVIVAAIIGIVVMIMMRSGAGQENTINEGLAMGGGGGAIGGRVGSGGAGGQQQQPPARLIPEGATSDVGGGQPSIRQPSLRSKNVSLVPSYVKTAANSKGPKSKSMSRKKAKLPMLAGMGTKREASRSKQRSGAKIK